MLNWWTVNDNSHPWSIWFLSVFICQPEWTVSAWLAMQEDGEVHFHHSAWGNPHCERWVTRFEVRLTSFLWGLQSMKLGMRYSFLAACIATRLNATNHFSYTPNQIYKKKSYFSKLNCLVEGGGSHIDLFVSSVSFISIALHWIKSPTFRPVSSSGAKQECWVENHFLYISKQYKASYWII